MKSVVITFLFLLGVGSWRIAVHQCSGNEPGAMPADREPPGRRAQAQVRAIDASGICVTSGGVARAARGRMRVDGPKMRGVAQGSSGDVGELRFLYRGATEQVAPLASGQIRRQVGLKLRAQDGCNLVYVMWRIDPKPGIEVQIKSNPGMRVNSECGNRGYKKMSPRRRAPVPTLAPGSEHSLHAELTGQDLHVWVDGAVVWEGDLGPEARMLSGPVGMRSDNVALELELLADPARQTASLTKVPGRCAPAGDSE